VKTDSNDSESSRTDTYVRSGRNFGTFALAGAVQTYVNDIDNALNILGVSYDSGGKHQSFLFFHNAGNFDIVAFPGAVSTWAVAMYDQNIVGWYSNTDPSGTPSVGTQTFLLKGSALSDGNYTSINFPGASVTTPNGVNVYGDIVGIYLDSAGLPHSFVYSGGSFATIDFPGATAGSTYAYAINATGGIVGPCSGYNRRSLVETTMFRYKTVIGRRLHARTLPNQRTEAKVGCNALNRMTGLGMPVSARIR
jgi:hypothetical protein